MPKSGGAKRVSFAPSDVDRIDSESSTPTYLWDAYISQRRPVVIEGTPTRASEGKWNVHRWADPSSGHAYLRRRAGRALVSVEYRSSNAKGFGLGNRRIMRFGEFLARLSSGSEQFYISSTEQPIGPHGFPDLMVSPLIELRRDFPTRLSWAGNLIPQQINIWFGSSSDGACSGLHHDYHDNFYVLLRGKKRFRLYPPSLHARMQTHGEVVKVHPNGRIVYRGQEQMNADGSHQEDVRMFYGHSEDERHDQGTNETSTGREDGKTMGDDEPPSFSRVGTEDLDMPPTIEFELRAGESLYLPAGWFHEVTSYGVNDGAGEHMALNYWLHPPTNLRRGAQGFERPYTSDFWPDVIDAGLVRKGTQAGDGKARSRKRRKSASIAYLKLRFGKAWHYFRKHSHEI